VVLHRHDRSSTFGALERTPQVNEYYVLVLHSSDPGGGRCPPPEGPTDAEVLIDVDIFRYQTWPAVFQDLQFLHDLKFYGFWLDSCPMPVRKERPVRMPALLL